MDLKQIQKRLNDLGYTPKLVVDGLNGPATKKAINWFQEKTKLNVTGVADKETLNKLLEGVVILRDDQLKPLPKELSKSLNIAAMEIALSQFNVKETTGKNDGPAVETYLESVGLGKGYSWCMAFVYWCYLNASERLGIQNPLKKTGGVLKQWNEVDKEYKIFVSEKNPPQVGDIFIMDFGKGLGHTGIITKIIDKNTVETIEGNANSLGSREGNQVGKLNRKGLKYLIRIV